MNLKTLIRTIPDFPKPGIRFRDITPLIGNPAGLRRSVDALAERISSLPGNKVDKIVGIEARGFIFGAAVAHALHAGFVPVRKPGKLPHAAHGHDYELEYGTGRVEMHADGIGRGERVVVIDDLLATGGTALAAVALVERCGATVVECSFVIELLDLPGRKRIEQAGHRAHALCGFTEAEA